MLLCDTATATATAAVCWHRDDSRVCVCGSEVCISDGVISTSHPVENSWWPRGGRVEGGVVMQQQQLPPNCCCLQKQRPQIVQQISMSWLCRSYDCDVKMWVWRVHHKCRDLEVVWVKFSSGSHSKQIWVSDMLCVAISFTVFCDTISLL